MFARLFLIKASESFEKSLAGAIYKKAKWKYFQTGYFQGFWRKKLWRSLFLEWIDAWPFTNNLSKKSDPPTPIQHKKNREKKCYTTVLANRKNYSYNRIMVATRTKYLIA